MSFGPTHFSPLPPPLDDRADSESRGLAGADAAFGAVVARAISGFTGVMTGILDDDLDGDSANAVGEMSEVIDGVRRGCMPRPRPRPMDADMDMDMDIGALDGVRECSVNDALDGVRAWVGGSEEMEEPSEARDDVRDGILEGVWGVCGVRGEEM